jgi:hypothetical protein
MPARLRRRPLADALAFALILLVPRPLAAQLTLDALELFVSSANGGATRAVRVRNDGAERVQAMVVQEDWDRDEHGTNRFLALGSHAGSCHDAIEVFPRAIALEPGESATVRIAVRAGTTPCWGVVFLEHRATQPGGGRQLNYTVRTGVKVYVEPAEAVRDGVLEAITVRALDAAGLDRAAASATNGPAASAANGPAVFAGVTAVDAAPGVDGSPALQLTFRNIGTSQLAVHGEVEVRSLDNQLVHRASVASVPVLPAAQRLLTVPLPALPPGRYMILALLDFGGAELVAGQLAYEVR